MFKTKRTREDPVNKLKMKMETLQQTLRIFQESQGYTLKICTLANLEPKRNK